MKTIPLAIVPRYFTQHERKETGEGHSIESLPKEGPKHDPSSTVAWGE